MRTIDRRTSALLVVDFQAKLMPAIADGAAVLANARRLLDAAALLGVPAIATEQNARGLGPTVPELADGAGAASAARTVVPKMTFDACRAPGFLDALQGRPIVVVAGCEAHVCVLQTVLGLIDDGRRVYVARDALGARRAESKEAAILRMQGHGAEIVTAEMVVFEWLESAEHPRFRDGIALVK